MSFAALIIYSIALFIALITIIIGIRLLIAYDKKLRICIMFLIFAIGFFALNMIGEIIGSKKIFGQGDFFVSLSCLIIILFIFFSILILNNIIRDVRGRKK